MNESPGARARVAYSGLSVAENFSNDGNDVLFYVDNMVNLAEVRLSFIYALIFFFYFHLIEINSNLMSDTIAGKLRDIFTDWAVCCWLSDNTVNGFQRFTETYYYK
jgi:hypothetical protein